MQVKILNLGRVLNVQNVRHALSREGPIIKGQSLLLTLNWGEKLIKGRDSKHCLKCILQRSLLYDLPVETSA